jgi:hypothetical protein
MKPQNTTNHGTGAMAPKDPYLVDVLDRKSKAEPEPETQTTK